MNKVIRDAKLLALSSDGCLNIIMPLGAYIHGMQAYLPLTM